MNDGASATSPCFSVHSVHPIENLCQNVFDGTETMKLCQEVVCPADSFKYDEKCV
jgi:hypothetical protein